MKTLLSLLLFILTISVSAQLVNIKATRQHWAGGVCCVTGTNYSISISGGLDTLNKMEFKSAIIDGNEFVINKVIDKTNQDKIFHFSFSVSQNHYREEIHDIKFEKTEDVVNKPNSINFIYQGQEMTIEINHIEELMYLAYP